MLVHIIKLQDEIKVNKEKDVALDDGKLSFDEFNSSQDKMIYLPPGREVNHAIHLVANATMVSKAPYSRSLAQIEELKD